MGTNTERMRRQRDRAAIWTKTTYDKSNQFPSAANTGRRSAAATFNLSSNLVVKIEIPADWTIRNRDLGARGMDFTITRKKDVNAACKITPFLTAKKQAPDREAVKETTLAACQQFVSGSVEKKAVVKDLAMKQGFGAYCQFTDASLVGKPSIKGNYKTTCSGFVSLADDVMGSVTILCDNLASDEFKAMRTIVESMQVQSGAGKSPP